jgi:hypothetical protein
MNGRIVIGDPRATRPLLGMLEMYKHYLETVKISFENELLLLKGQPPVRQLPFQGVDDFEDYSAKSEVTSRYRNLGFPAPWDRMLKEIVDLPKSLGEMIGIFPELLEPSNEFLKLEGDFKEIDSRFKDIQSLISSDQDLSKKLSVPFDELQTAQELLKEAYPHTQKPLCKYKNCEMI